MPLLVCTLFFILLFSCEGLWYILQRDHEKAQLRRYEEVEHPHRVKRECYLDRL